MDTSRTTAISSSSCTCASSAASFSSEAMLNETLNARSEPSAFSALASAEIAGADIQTTEDALWITRPDIDATVASTEQLSLLAYSSPGFVTFPMTQLFIVLTAAGEALTGGKRTRGASANRRRPADGCIVGCSGAQIIDSLCALARSVGGSSAAASETRMRHVFAQLIERSVAQLRSMADVCTLADAAARRRLAGQMRVASCQLQLLRRGFRAASTQGPHGRSHHRVSTSERLAFGTAAGLVVMARAVAETTNVPLCQQIGCEFDRVVSHALNVVDRLLASSTLGAVLGARQAYAASLELERTVLSHALSALQQLHREHWFAQLRQASCIDALHMKASVVTFALFPLEDMLRPRECIQQALVNEAARRGATAREPVTMAATPGEAVVITLADLPTTHGSAHNAIDSMLVDSASCSMGSMTSLGSLGSVYGGGD